jgi:hypothetical protein
MHIKCDYFISTERFRCAGIDWNVSTAECCQNDACVPSCIDEGSISVSCTCSKQLQGWVVCSYEKGEDILECCSAQGSQKCL